MMNKLTLNKSSSCSMFLSTSFSTWSTSNTEWSSPFTRCKYKSVLVLSTDPSLFSCTLKSSMLTTEFVTRASFSRKELILSRISEGCARRTKRTLWSSRRRYMNTWASSSRPSVSFTNTLKKNSRFSPNTRILPPVYLSKIRFNLMAKLLEYKSTITTYITMRSILKLGIAIHEMLPNRISTIDTPIFLSFLLNYIQLVSSLSIFCHGCYQSQYIFKLFPASRHMFRICKLW